MTWRKNTLIVKGKTMSKTTKQQVDDLIETGIKTKKYFENCADTELVNAVDFAKRNWILVMEPLLNKSIIYHLKTQPDPNECQYDTEKSTNNYDDAMKSLLFFRGLFACKQIYDNRLDIYDNSDEYKMHDFINKYQPELYETWDLNTFVMNVMNELNGYNE